MRFFDCNVGFGQPPNAAATVLRTAEELVRELDFCGVAEALVHHTAIRHESAQAGNCLVVDETADHARLHPTWAILPPQTHEFGTVHEFLADMRRHGVGALRAYPAEHRYLLNGLTFGSLFEELVPRRIPLMVGPHWAALTQLLADFPDLTVIIVGHGDWGDDRYFRPLVARYPRLHLDTSNYQTPDGIADFVGQYGHERLVYGSGFPPFQMGGALLTLARADISDEGKEAIAGENLRRLLREADP